MRRSTWPAALLGVAILIVGVMAQGPGNRGGARTKPGEPCPPGTTETRPGSCQAPEFPAPSIVDYRPRSTLVTAQHQVPKAKFPVVDIHGHASLSSPEGIASVVARDGCAEPPRVRERRQLVRRAPHADARRPSTPARTRIGFRMLAGVDFRNVGPGWADQAVRQLEADIKAGAVGVGEISKSFGLNIRKRDGSRLKVDDPELDPLWQAFARLDVPVFIHTAEPQEFFQPLDNQNERWLELALFANRRNNQPGHVTFDELMTERNNVFTQASQDALHRRAFRLARQRSAEGRRHARCVSQRRRRGGRDSLRPRPPAARRARLLREVSGSNSVRQGRVPAGRVSVLLAGLRNAATSTSTTTATITPSGSSTAWTFPTPCSRRCTSKTLCAS